MATKEDIIAGLEALIREGRRIAADLSPEDWAKAQDMDGWKNREVLAHVAAIGGLVPAMVGGMSNAPAGADAGAGLDIDALNAGLVAQRAERSVAALADELETAYRGVIDFVRSAPDDLLAKKVTMRGYIDVPVSDLLVRMVVLHGLAHIYSAYSAVMG